MTILVAAFDLHSLTACGSHPEREQFTALIAENPGLSITVKADADTVPSKSVNVIGNLPGTAAIQELILMPSPAPIYPN